MKTIHKYSLALTNEQRLNLHSGYKVLSVQVQNAIPTIWVQVDLNHAKAPATIFCFGTGHELDFPPDVTAEYIGTIQLNGFVWHFFDGGFGVKQEYTI